MGGPRYDVEEVRALWRKQGECARQMIFWQLLADSAGRPLVGFYKRFAIAEGWAAKTTGRQRCLVCRKWHSWRDFFDGGPLRVCTDCAEQTLGEEVST